MGTSRIWFTTLLPESSKIFELHVYFENQIMSSLWDIFIFYHLIDKNKTFYDTTQYQNEKCNIVKSESITIKFFFKKFLCFGLF